MMLKFAPLSLAALLLTGCSGAPQALSFSEISHVHSVVINGDDIILATHYGLYVWNGTGWTPRGDNFDVMALAEYGGALFASGHPGPSQNLPDPLGLKVSTNGGETWGKRSLLGEVDFHLLSVAGDTIVGVAANYGEVVRSTDGGTRWAMVNVPSLTDLSVSPLSPGDLMVASEGTLLLSTDSGETFQAIDSPAGVQLVEWAGSQVLVSTGPTLFLRENDTDDFVALTHRFNGVSHITMTGAKIVVVDADGVNVSTDGGLTFRGLS